jgi:hypothetical protein
MKAKSRIKKIEREIQGQSRIPNSERFISFSPNETEEEKEVKFKNLLEELKRKYGEDVPRQDIVIMRVIYDDKLLSGKDELISKER